MRKLTFLFIFFLAAAAGLFGQKTVQLNYAYSGFSGINASSSFTIYVEKGEEYSIVITTDNEMADNVQVDVSGGVLSLSLKSGSLKSGKYKLNTLKAHITMPTLDYVTLTGACDLISEATFVSEKFQASLSGSSDMKLNIRADQADISLLGASDLTMNIEAMKMNLSASGSSDAILSGKIMNLSVNCLGSSDLKASGLMASEIKISASGSSDIVINANGASADITLLGASSLTMNAETSDLKLNVSGASEAKLTGKTENFQITCLGGSDVIAPNMIAQNVVVSASGGCDVNVYAEKLLEASATGGSSVVYGGNPAVTSKTLGTGTVKKK